MAKQQQSGRRVIAAINMTVDGYCDHTAGIADDELHQHYTDLLAASGTILYGRKTFQLMEYWLTVLDNPTGNASMDDFAKTIDGIHKIVFSRTLKNVGWKTATLAKKDLREELLQLKQQTGGNILIGSPSLIVSYGNLGLIDEYQLCVHPVVTGKGLPLFKNTEEIRNLNLSRTKTFGSGAIILYYESNKGKS